MTPLADELVALYGDAVRWLTTSTIRDPDGAVYSWINPAKPGYVYPEIMGYYTKLFSLLYRKAGDPRMLELATRTADRLASLVSEAGAVSRDGVDYAFDSAVCLSGLIALSRAAGTVSYRKPITSLARFVARALEGRTVAFSGGEPVVDEDAWSLSFGAASLKTCIALQEAAEFLSEPSYGALAREVAESIVAGCFRGGYFTINAQRPWVYTHSHCYATEGLLFLGTHPGVVKASADWLARVQNEDGSLFNWYCRPGKVQGRQGDATSQAMRIWSAVDKEAYAEHIGRAFGFLKTLRTAEGGLVYSRGSADVNSWVTMFAAQAALWLTDGPDRRGVV